MKMDNKMVVFRHRQKHTKRFPDGNNYHNYDVTNLMFLTLPK
jgi:hypothetical protein